MVFSMDGTEVLTESFCFTEKTWATIIWDTSTGKRKQALSAHTDQVWSAAFSTDGTSVLTLGKTAKLWETSSGDCKQTLATPLSCDWVGYFAIFSPDGSSVLITYSDRTARVWATSTGECKQMVAPTGDFSPEHTVRPPIQTHIGVFSPDGNSILTTFDDHWPHLWDTSTGGNTHQVKLVGHKDRVTSAVFSPVGFLPNHDPPNPAKRLKKKDMSSGVPPGPQK